jgi:hypothetical protein
MKQGQVTTMAELLAHAEIGNGLVAEIYEDGVLWLSKAVGKHQEIKLTDDAPTNLLNFLTTNRNLLQEPGQDEQETFAED